MEPYEAREIAAKAWCDAERYRVLKNGDFSVEQFVSSSYGWRFVPTEELDSAIDAAMQEVKS